MKPFATAIALLFCAVAFGQGIKEVQIVISPTYSTRFLDADKEFKSGFNEVEKGMISYDFGLLVYPLNKKRFALGTGLLYSRKGYIWADYMGRDMNGVPVDVRIKESVNYLEIPVKMKYHLGESAKMYLLAGLTNDILINSKVEGTEGLNNAFQYDLRKYNLGVNIGLGYDFKISERVAVGLEPNIKFQSMPYIGEETQAKRFLYTAGLAIITRLGFKGEVQ